MKVLISFFLCLNCALGSEVLLFGYYAESEMTPVVTGGGSSEINKSNQPFQFRVFLMNLSDEAIYFGFNEQSILDLEATSGDEDFPMFLFRLFPLIDPIVGEYSTLEGQTQKKLIPAGSACLILDKHVHVSFRDKQKLTRAQASFICDSSFAYGLGLFSENLESRIFAIDEIPERLLSIFEVWKEGNTSNPFGL
jgi:hypothetical protein